MSNPRHIKHTDLLREHITMLTILTLLVLYHTPVHFSLSCSSIHNVPQPLPLFRVLSFHLKLLRGYPLTELFIRLVLS